MNYLLRFLILNILMIPFYIIIKLYSNYSWLRFILIISTPLIYYVVFAFFKGIVNSGILI